MIWIVEDEQAISRVLQVYLRKEGFETRIIERGDEVVKLLREGLPTLILLDVMLPEVSGWEVLEHIRKRSSCPVIMLTALSDVPYRIKGLNGGADDFVPKPFDPNEVVARVKTVLRRQMGWRVDENVLQYGQLTIHEDAHKVCLSGEELALTPRDLSLLLFLGKHPNQTFTREQLIEQVWGMDFDGSDRAVDLSIKRIRRELTDWSVEEGHIKTIRRLGYQLCVE